MEMQSEKFCTGPVETTETLTTNGGDNNPLEAAVIPDGSPAPESEVDNSWEDQLDACKQQIEELQEEYEQSFLEIGRVLVQARNIYKGHGNWLAWLRNNVPFSVRHAQRLIRVAEVFDDAPLVSQLGLTPSKAYVLTRVSKDDMVRFSTTLFSVGDKQKLVKNMTRRELESAVTKFLRDKLTQTNQEGGAPNQGEKPLKKSVESNFQELKMVLNKTISSIISSDSGNRDSWISALQALYKSGVDQLTSASE